MAQFTIKWPNGAEISFEGDVDFSDLEGFLQGNVPPVFGSPATAREEARVRAADETDEEERPTITLIPGTVEARFEEVGARTDVERVAVMAYEAVRAGFPGIDVPTAENVYRELALRMPGVWRSTFSNAQTRGYIKSAGQGFWAPTSAGDNFARLGQRRPSAARRRTRRTGNDTQ
jgi:hypothetical protein